MKKLNLQLGSIKEMLTKEQMKKVAGGYDGGDGCGGAVDDPCVEVTCYYTMGNPARQCAIVPDSMSWIALNDCEASCAEDLNCLSCS